MKFSALGVWMVAGLMVNASAWATNEPILEYYCTPADGNAMGIDLTVSWYAAPYGPGIRGLNRRYEIDLGLLKRGGGMVSTLVWTDLDPMVKRARNGKTKLEFKSKAQPKSRGVRMSLSIELDESGVNLPARLSVSGGSGPKRNLNLLCQDLKDSDGDIVTQ